MNYVVSVDCLVLDGVAPRHGRRVADAFASELSRLLSERPPSRETPSAEVLDAGTPHVRGSRPESLGRAAAHALHQGLVA